MSYRAILSLNAQNDIRSIGAERVRRYVLAQISNLERDPTLLSGPSRFPFRLKSQLFTFDYDHEGRRYFINVLFQYGADEQSLYVSDIVCQALTEWWDPDDTDQPDGDDDIGDEE